MAINTNTNEAIQSKAVSQIHYADSSDPDIRYLSGFYIPDPFYLLTRGEHKIGITGASEYHRMKTESQVDEVLLLPEVEKETMRSFHLPEGKKPDAGQVIRYLAKRYGIDRFQVGSRFSAGLLTKMRNAGLSVEVELNGELLPQRQIKTADELKLLRKANRASTAGFQMVAKILAESKVFNGLLKYKGQTLTSEYLRRTITHVCLEYDAFPMNTIVACGDQACDTHCVGYGPIRAGELIIVDIFPQRTEDGYWGDMTRTYLKGRASDAQKRLVRTVKKAHELAIGMIKPGMVGGRVHQAVEDFFAKEGYETSKGAEAKGFFHALGHGVGLEIHEEPIMRAKAPFRLRKGMVMAVEPGLYYRGLGGARVEDCVHVVTGGCEKISTAPYKWEIQ